MRPRAPSLRDGNPVRFIPFFRGMNPPAKFLSAFGTLRSLHLNTEDGVHVSIRVPVEVRVGSQNP
jgi:hypothetical protein